MKGTAALGASLALAAAPLCGHAFLFPTAPRHVQGLVSRGGSVEHPGQHLAIPRPVGGLVESTPGFLRPTVRAQHSCTLFSGRLADLFPSSSVGAAASGADGTARLGTITLVGAGPGDPDLLTLGAVKALANSDALVIADRLISKEILALIGGELRIARKHPGCAEQAQQEIYQWVREAVTSGRDVIRLKIGDPFLFGRGGEEVIEYRQYGVEPKIVPGVSSAFAAPLLSNIAVTHRSVSNQVYICTGFGKDGERPYLAPYYQNQTAVFLMAVGRLQELCDNLVQVGYPTSTPVAVVERASTPNQRTLLGTVGTIADVAARFNAKPPAVIVVGEVVPVLLGEDAMELGELKGMSQQLDSVLAGVQQPKPEPVWAGVGRGKERRVARDLTVMYSGMSGNSTMANP